MTRAHTVQKQSLVSRKFFLFLVTGGIAAGVNWGSRFIYNLWMPYSTAIIVAYVTGMITAFILAKLFVFTESTQSTHRSLLFFTLVNLVAAAQTWAVSMLLAFYLLPRIGIVIYARDIAHLVGVAVPVFTSYFGHKKLSFKH